MLSIITDLFGPIFAKEMVEMSRRWRYYQNRILFGVVVLLVLLMVHENSRFMYNNRGGFTIQMLSKMAEIFFLSYLWVQYLSVYIFVPFFLTGVIAGEREQKTLDLLFTTQLGNREIIFGKLGSRVVSMMMLILSGVPIVAITMLFGGVNGQVFVYALLATMLAVLYTSAMAIYFSTTTKTTMGALVRTYWWLLCWLLIVPMVIMAGMQLMFEWGVASGSSSSFQTRMDWQLIGFTTICVINPLASFVVSVVDFYTGQLQALMGTWYFFYLLIVPTLWSLLLIFLAIRNVRREPGPRKATIALRKIISTVFGILTLRPITSRLLALLPKSRVDRWLWFPVKNPLWQRARRAWVYDREQHLQRAQLGGWILVIIVLLMIASLEKGFFNQRESALIFMVWIWMGLAIAACLVSGISIINDRRRGFFEFVLVTPLHHWEIVQGTFQACWRHIKKMYMLIIVMMLFFTAIGCVPLWSALLSVFLGTLNVMLLMLHGIACSLVARSVTGALIGTFMFPIVTLVVPPMLTTIFRGDGTTTLVTCCVLLMPLSSLFVWWRKNVFTVSFFLTMMHFSILAVLTCWLTNSRDNRELPLMAIHPGIHVFEPLMNYGYSDSSRFGHIWGTVVVLYAAGLLINMVWLSWWICRHYELLSGRKQLTRRKDRTKQALVQAVTLQPIGH